MMPAAEHHACIHVRSIGTLDIVNERHGENSSFSFSEVMPECTTQHDVFQGEAQPVLIRFAATNLVSEDQHSHS